MLSNGMHELGFDHVNLGSPRSHATVALCLYLINTNIICFVDDCWAAQTRDVDGSIRPDPDRFPSGMRAMADWLHDRGLKFGLYTRCVCVCLCVCLCMCLAIAWRRWLR